MGGWGGEGISSGAHSAPAPGCLPALLCPSLSWKATSGKGGGGAVVAGQSKDTSPSYTSSFPNGVLAHPPSQVVHSVPAGYTGSSPENKPLLKAKLPTPLPFTSCCTLPRPPCDPQQYRQLGSLRKAIPSVPVIALTATATISVQKDIERSLFMRAGLTDKWVMSFERPNLYFQVKLRQGPVLDNFPELLEAKSLGESAPAIVYTITRKESETVGAALQTAGYRAAAYHAGMSLQQRKAVHKDFQLDNLEVVVATISFGMGIDKPNVRLVYHYGAPGSVEAYYQQAGRAGRDGLPARCILAWSAKDFSVHSFMNKKLSAQGSSKANQGLTHMRNYCNSTECRQRFFVKFFGSAWTAGSGSCKGGCDMCEVAVAMKDVNPSSSRGGRDMKDEALLLLQAIIAFGDGGSGILKPIELLVGSRRREIRSKTDKDKQGRPLHSAGAAFSKDWWKALAQEMIRQNLLQNKQIGVFTIVSLTMKGHAFLVKPPQAFHPMPNSPLLAIEKAMKQLQESATQAGSSVQVAAQPAMQAEIHRLQQALFNHRAAVAGGSGMAPVNVCTDVLVMEMAGKRPGSEAALRACEGAHDAFVRSYGQDFLNVIRTVCANSAHLKLDGWNTKAKSGLWADRRQFSAAKGGPAGEAPPLLAVPKSAAVETFARFNAGEKIPDIAYARSVKLSTAAGYIADYVAAEEIRDPGVWKRLASEGMCSHSLTCRIREQILEHRNSGLGHVKRSLPPEVEFGDIKVMAAAIHLGCEHFLGVKAQPVGCTNAAHGDKGTGDSRILQHLAVSGSGSMANATNPIPECPTAWAPGTVNLEPGNEESNIGDDVPPASRLPADALPSQGELGGGPKAGGGPVIAEVIEVATPVQPLKKPSSDTGACMADNSCAASEEDEPLAVLQAKKAHSGALGKRIRTLPWQSSSRRKVPRGTLAGGAAAAAAPPSEESQGVRKEDVLEHLKTHGMQTAYALEAALARGELSRQADLTAALKDLLANFDILKIIPGSHRSDDSIDLLNNSHMFRIF
mmetsp:Transcript_1843/g.5358  ORF Transcript_1843/g.5358 Transcript_1843/m.5358 type:complete len:1020 (-) Transcript_1843:1050-4109(-)